MAGEASRSRRIAFHAIVVMAMAVVGFTVCYASGTGPAPLPGGSATVSGAAADTARIGETGIIWSKEELKKELTEQSGIARDGTAVKSKNARVAMLCALLFPGLGQMYNERPFKAIIAMGVETFYVSQILFNHRNYQRAERRREKLPYGSSEWNRQNWWVDEYKERRLDWIWWASGMLVVLVLDSYIDAHLYDMSVGIEGTALEGGAGVQLILTF